MIGIITTEAIIAGKYPLYASKFTGAYSRGYVFEGRRKLEDELRGLFPEDKYRPLRHYDSSVLGGFRSELPKGFNSKRFKEQLQKFLRASRNKAFLTMYNTFDGFGEFGMDSLYEQFLGIVDRREFGVAYFMVVQGNIRGVPIGSPVEAYRKAINRFTTKAHSLQDNQIYILTSQMNTGNDCLAGVAPILFDLELRERFPEDTLILARKYLPVVEMNANNYKKTIGAHLWQENFDRLKREYKL